MVRTVVVLRDGEPIGGKIKVAETFWQRLRGLWGKKSLSPEEGLVLVGCKQIHTFFMKFPLDAVFLNQEGEIIHLYSRLPPGRISRWVKDSRYVLELPSGTVEELNLQMGKKLEINYSHKN